MSKYVKNHDSTSTWQIDESGRNWLLKPGASIETEGFPAVLVAAGSSSNTIRLLGDIEADGPGAMAIVVRGTDNRLILGARSSVEGSIGIHDLGAANTIVARGEITGLNIGIRSTEQTAMRISGEVTGGTTGIELEGAVAGSVVRIERNASVTGGERGIGLSDGTDVRIVIKGELSSDHDAIMVSTGDSTIINRGAVFGDIETGSGDDTIDTRGGSVSGVIRGGSHGDDYWISDAGIEIVEDAVYGYDRLFTSVSYTLPDNLEEIWLIGKKNVDATGNGEHNNLKGNKGGNALSGLAGIDTLEGARGNDVLTGGTDDDYFIFQRHSGIDTITDFENGTDFIYIWNYAGLNGFHDIETLMTQHGGDVWIQLTAKDRIIIENIDILDLDEADFEVDSDVHLT